jgi:formylglycine-generating enzyme required for sulfatase activity
MDRIESIDGFRAEVRQDWTQMEKSREPGAKPFRVRLARADRAIDIEGPGDQNLEDALGMAEGIEGARLLAQSPAPRSGYRLLCLRGGELRTVRVPAGQTSGLTVERTAYPLLLGRGLGHRLEAPGTGRKCAPGSYLLYARAPGREDQRYPVLVARGKAEPAQVRIRLLAAGTSPEGFVFVPPGVFVYGGDLEAVQPAPRIEIDMRRDPALQDGFWMARHELTWAEWLEFLDDPETRAGLVPGRSEFLPRQSSGALARQGDDGGYEQTMGSPEAAVLGVSWADLMDAKGFVAWKNRRAGEAGSRWRYDLPSELEWERAARGCDGRGLPWGPVFDFALCASPFCKPYPAHVLPPGAVPEDESPSCVRDLAGGRYEWCRGEFSPGSGSRVLRGGSWGFSNPTFFRAASRRVRGPSDVGTDFGARMVARPLPVDARR